jgi:hypothetical protein
MEEVEGGRIEVGYIRRSRRGQDRRSRRGQNIRGR